MFCTKCGFNNPDGTRFCIRCGNSMEAPAPAPSQPSVQQAQAPQRLATPSAAPQSPSPVPAYAGAGNTPVYTAPANKGSGSNEIAKRAGSVLFLIGVICFTIPAILSLMSTFVGGGSLRAMLIPILQQVGASGSVIGSVMQSAGILSVIGAIPALVITAGLWIIFATAKSSKGNSISRAGFIMIKVITIISMIAAIIIFVVVLISMILAAAGVGSLARYSSRAGSSGVGVMIALILVLIAVMVLVIIYYSKLNRMLGSMSKVIRKGSGKPFISKYVMVFTFIAALGSVLSIITSLSSYEIYRNFGLMLPAGRNILSILPNLFNAAACVIFGIIMAKARGKRYGQGPDSADKLRADNNNVQPVYGNPGAQPGAAPVPPVPPAAAPQPFSQPQAAPQQYGQYVPPVVPPFQSAPQPEPAQYTPPVQNIQPEPFAQPVQPEEPVFKEPVFNEPEPVIPAAEPVFEQPVQEAPQYSDPVFEQPVQEAPQYSEPVFEQPVPEPVFEQPAAEPVQFTQPAPEPFVQPEPVINPSYQEDTFGSTVILKENLPEQEPAPVPTLTRATTGEFVRIEKSNFLIGKDPYRNDYTIQGNSAISRQHAEITFDGTDYYIVDHNSSNHVYINGGIIKPELFYPIEDGDIIKLADEDFTFSIK